MDASPSIPRSVVESTIFLRGEVPESHPSVAALGEERAGAGVAVAPDRVLTAHYLVIGAEKLRVAAPDGKSREVERISLDHETGLALLTLSGSPLRPVRIGRAREVVPGAPVFLLTYDGPDSRRGATGHVSAVCPFEAFWEFMLDRAIMTTVINPGLTGGPLFDCEARLLGVVSLGLASVGRYSLAIPADLYLERQEAFEAPEEHRSLRAWIGFYAQGHSGGVVVAGVVPGGPAEKAGIERGDVVLSVDGSTVSNLRELYQRIWRRQPGESLSLQILRDASIRVVEVAAEDRYEFYR